MFKRLIFLILLLFNVMLFAWGYQHKSPEQATQMLPKLEGPSILLLAEAPPTSFALPAGQSTTRHCARIGPIDSQLTATELAAILNSAGHETALETETTNQNSGFWLVIATTDEQSASLMAELNAAGVLDVLRFDKGPLAGMLSLGIYSDRAKAEKRLNVLSKKGFQAEIKPREIEVPSYWVRTYYTTTDQAAQGAVDQIYERYPGLTFPPPDCSS